MENKEEKDSALKERKLSMNFAREDFRKLIINDLSSTKVGRKFLKSYTQSQVREIIEGYKLETNQNKLREISELLWAKSPQYQRLIKYFAGMALFSHVITPIKELKQLDKKKIREQYVEIGELAKLMNLRHEMTKVLNVVFREDIFYGYIHKDKKSFYIQQMPSEICKITSIEDGVFNYSVDMTYFQRNEDTLHNWAIEIQKKYQEWKIIKSRYPTHSQWVELEATNTICIKMNEDILEIFPPFAGIFDSIFDIEAFKELRKDKEQLGNYMILTQKLPIRENTETNNDFMIDKDFMMFFHNQASSVVPDSVGVITSPMDIEAVRFDKDRVDSDGVGKATRDFWEGTGVSQLLFSSDNTSSAGLSMSTKSDEEIVFTLLTQIERWLNRYLKNTVSDLMFNINILPITRFNHQEMYKMYLEAAQYSVPVKSHLSAAVGLDPIEMMNMSFLENDILEIHENWVPLQSSHTMSGDELAAQSGDDGRPTLSNTEISDEGDKSRDKNS